MVKTKKSVKKVTKVTAAKKAVAKKAATKKSEAKTAKKAEKSQKTLVATRILKDGSLSTKSYSFESLKEAAEWAVKHDLTDKVSNARMNIYTAYAGKDGHGARFSAYGFVWERK